MNSGVPTRVVMNARGSPGPARDARASGPRAFGGLRFPGQRDFLRVWREHPRLEFHFRAVAWAWTRKLTAVRSGFPSASANEPIQSSLSSFIFEFRVCNQKCHYWLQKEFDVDGRTDIAKLREAIEGRLGSFVEAGRIARNTLGSFSATKPAPYESGPLGINPIFTPPSPGIFQKRTQSGKQRRKKQIGPEWPRYRVRF